MDVRQAPVLQNAAEVCETVQSGQSPSLYFRTRRQGAILPSFRRMLSLADKFHHAFRACWHAVMRPGLPRRNRDDRPMLHGFSRTTLSVLIIVCLLLISWIHLGFKDEEEQPLPALTQPLLADAGWRYWQSLEGVGVYLRSAGDVNGGYLALRTTSAVYTLKLPATDWAESLKQQLPGNLKGGPALLLIAGPWDELSQKTMAAYVIRSLNLQPLEPAGGPLPACIAEHLAGALWLTQALLPASALQPAHAWAALYSLPDSLALLTRPDATGPTRSAWAEWRLEQTRILRQNWQNDLSQIDIQADLAYYRPPEDLYRQLYHQLGQSQKTAPAELLQCLSAALPQREPSQH